MFRTVSSVFAILLVLLLAGCGGGGGGGDNGGGVDSAAIIVIGYNDLGMHCMNQDFSEIMILPPYNILHAQVIQRGDEPHIITGGYTLTYSIPGNTHSTDKTNFWTYANALLGITLAPNVGLTGNGLSGTMIPTGNNDWYVTGIPITPITDAMVENAYQLATIAVTQGSQTVATTQTVVPVSWEISCQLCHDGDGGAVSTATDILQAHDEEHGTTLVNEKPVMCGRCHAQPPLGQAGTPGVPNLSRAMHNSHASRMDEAGLEVACYACHPGIRTKCQRDIHSSRGMNCLSCHGDMTQVASSARRPWVDEPKCSDCHAAKPGWQYEEPGKTYKESRGHHGVHCAACHGSPHAITPTVTAADNVQAIRLQGFAGTISKCTVCHTTQPDDEFDHRFSGD